MPILECNNSLVLPVPVHCLLTRHSHSCSVQFDIIYNLISLLYIIAAVYFNSVCSVNSVLI